MLEEKIGDLHSIRKNLVFISIFNILTFLFSDHIEEINFLAFKLKNTNENCDFLILFIILLIVNIYTFWRYYQYLKAKPLKRNYKLFLREIINNGKYKILYVKDLVIHPDYMDKTKLIPEKYGDLFIEYMTRDGLPSKKIIRDFFTNDKYDIDISDDVNKNKKDKYKDRLFIVDKNEKDNNKKNICYLNFNNKDISEKKLYFHDKYYADIFMPFVLGLLSLILVIIKIYENFCIL